MSINRFITYTHAFLELIYYKVGLHHLLCVQLYIVEGVIDDDEVLVPGDHGVVPPMIGQFTECRDLIGQFTECHDLIGHSPLLPHVLPGLVSWLVTRAPMLQIVSGLDNQHLAQSIIGSGSSSLTVERLTLSQTQMFVEMRCMSPSRERNR